MKPIVFVAAILAVCTAGSAIAQTPPGDPKIDPNIPPPTVQTIPLVLGEVTGVSSHAVVVRTTRGESMTFETDSRTVMPARDVTGRRVKVEFHLMPSGTHHAGRITVLEPGSLDWARYDQELAYYPQESETRLAANQGSSATDRSSDEPTAGSASSADADANVLRSDQDATTDEPVAANQTDGAESAGASDELPRTASSRPLLLGLGLTALASGAAIGWIRRRREV
jgi:LPXTG-motif cell wall-anchored protein